MPNSTMESLVRDAPKSISKTGESSCSKFALMEENISISKKDAVREQSETIERYLEIASFWVATTSTLVLSFVSLEISELLPCVFISSKEASFLGKMK